VSLPAEISVAELKRMHDANDAFTLVDVREDDELAIAAIPWAKHIPMGSIVDRSGELSKDAPLVIMCHGGTRSGRVAKYLRDNGFTNVANLAGGIDAWSHEIDPAVPTY
jgi:rhodanese-related sulfurtransferase